jgi:hypothetical protein
MDLNVVAGTKTHPLDREMLPEDPLELQAFEVAGDTDLMSRIMIEEYARMGYGAADLLALARDPFFAALHGLLRLYGEEAFQHRVSEVLARVGVTRVRTVEAPPASSLLQIESRST